ncbi:dTDP-4-amino-4,6-dideoxygalactose transaminase [Geothermobacter ehrlichii]|uniref:dTDP-4-amino-4,6-dideoxygalactose transaminase n=1 Tax=Geothermobacter ehrlichii TaxID=213224 RepID=A0A5D3WNT4_9BACT|nr:dTDP-4-amino-4,6-dideoxygalactose transaminase [Geothermobacter ehrlichii]TYO99019.1 dTDP-4-amino-4,6-dideoxygalactose transaminase [Geothermobacter ehrlichii]
MIKFNRPFIAGKELYYISQAVMKYSHISGDGEFTRKCQRWFEETLGCKKALLTHSCTAALEMAALLCDIRPGDEVIMPSFTFVSTANAFVLRGATPVFVDIRPDTLNIDEKLLASAVTEKTRAVVPVHYAGVPCDMDTILEVARDKGLFVIEDAAQALLSKDETGFAGARGDFGCVSFHETKNIISGEGGALFVNNEQFIERAEIIREKGTNRSKFFRGEVDKYTWVDVGSSFLPSDIIAAFLYAQLEHAEEIVTRRKELLISYREKLEDLECRGMCQLPARETLESSSGHIFYLLCRSLEDRDALLAFLKQRGIGGVFHYVPLHDSPFGKQVCRVHGTMKETLRAAGSLLRLPLYYEMTDEEQDRCVEAVYEFYQDK